MAVINPQQNIHPTNQTSTPEGSETGSDSTSSASSSSSSDSSSSSTSSSSSDAAARRRRRRREQEAQAALTASRLAAEQNTESEDESVVTPHAETSEATPVAESAGTSGDEDQGDGQRGPDEEEEGPSQEGPSQAEGPSQVEDTNIGELSIPTWGGVLLRNGEVVGSVGPSSNGQGDTQAGAEKARQLMTEQSQLFDAEVLATADTAAAESERLTGLASQMRTIAEHWRDSGHDDGWQDEAGNAITASAHYVAQAESIEAKAQQNQQIAQQNAAEMDRVKQHNADAQDALTRFGGAEASALSRLQDGTATAADYAHVADTYAQLQETWQEDPSNNLVPPYQSLGPSSHSPPRPILSARKDCIDDSPVMLPALRKRQPLRPPRRHSWRTRRGVSLLRLLQGSYITA